MCYIRCLCHHLDGLGSRAILWWSTRSPSRRTCAYCEKLRGFSQQRHVRRTGAASVRMHACETGRVPDRDRDEAGKARNRRPRDALGRPLPHGSQGVSRIPDDLHLSATTSLTYAQELLDRGLAFNAHEVLEAAWKDAPDDERAMWQGLAQLAVGITHIQRGNIVGAKSVLRRAADRLRDGREACAHDIDVDGLIRHTEGLIMDLGQRADIAVNRLRPCLRNTDQHHGHDSDR